MSSAGIRRTGQGGEQRGKLWRGGGVPEFWPQPSAGSQRAGGRQRKVGRRRDEDKRHRIEKGRGEER